MGGVGDKTFILHIGISDSLYVYWISDSVIRVKEN